MFKRIKRLLSKRNNGGFTLVEVIVATALLGVLMLGMFGFVQPVLKSVRAKEQNARAVMLVETVESYIANSTKYAYFVQTFSGVTAADFVPGSSSDPSSPPAPPIKSAKYVKDPAIDSIADEDLKEEARLNNLVCEKAANDLFEMVKVLEKKNKSAKIYEIRCIGMRWMEDPKSGEWKLMLTNEVVDQKSCAIIKTTPVFETCFYDGLYPILKINNYHNQYKILDSAGNLKDKYTDESKLEIAPAIEITMDVYLDANCYSVTESVRKAQSQTFTGTTYANFKNISSPVINPSPFDYKIVPGARMHSYNEAMGLSESLVYPHPDVGNTYYPDTFIYYIARKTKTKDNPGSGTPAPTPTT